MPPKFEHAMEFLGQTLFAVFFKGFVAVGVKLVSNDGVTCVMAMNPDLVLSAGQEATLDQCAMHCALYV